VILPEESQDIGLDMVLFVSVCECVCVCVCVCVWVDLVRLGLNSGLHTFYTCRTVAVLLETHLQPIFALVILEMGVSQSICPCYPWTAILPILACQVARITGVSHQCPARCVFSRYFRGDPCCLFQVLEATCIPWLVAPSSILKGHRSRLFPSSYLLPNSEPLTSLA
jgi:hypothetical protein